ncbi:MAG: TlpA disulfide reductase family protein [Syntrophaceae bacterium]
MRRMGIITGVFFGLLLYLSPCGYGAETMPGIYKAAAKEQAPDFTLKDLYGRTVNFKAYQGRNVLLVFTTTWCPYCKKEIAELKQFHKTYKGKLDIVAVYVNESTRKVFGFVREYKIPYTVLVDPEGAVARTYGIIGVPTRVLVGRDGTMLCWMCRSLDKDLDRLIAAQK